jgi:hypothetical protein
MNTQQSVFTEIMEGLTLLFIAALLLGFILVVSKVVYLLMIEYKEKRKTKEAIDYEKEAQELISELTGHPYVNNLDVTQSDDEFWDYYYQITGRYKGNKFWIYINKGGESDPELCIRNHVTDGARQFQDFLKTLTPLTFIIS